MMTTGLVGPPATGASAPVVPAAGGSGGGGGGATVLSTRGILRNFTAADFVAAR